MRAIVLRDDLRFINNYPEPIPAQDESLLAMRLAGICNTDLELLAGYKSFQGVLGHEFVAVVVEGPETLVGQRVVGEINIACQKCDFCLKGIPSQCRFRTAIGIQGHDGVFADRIALVTRNLYQVPERIPDDVAVFTEPLAAALNILEVVHISPRMNVTVIGAGKLGLLAAQVLHHVGADVTVVVRREKPARLLNQWGIRAVAPDEVKVQQASVVVDCTGNEEGFAAASNLVEPRGTIVLKSTYSGIPQADLSKIAVNEIRVIGSRCGPFQAALRLLEQQMVDVESLIDARFCIDESDAAFEAANQPGALKVLIEF